MPVAPYKAPGERASVDGAAAACVCHWLHPVTDSPDIYLAVPTARLDQ